MNVGWLTAMEVSSTKYRIVTGFFYQAMFTLGECTVGLIAIWVRDWRTLQLIVSVPVFITAVICWVLPESIRWLITVKKYDEAAKLIVRAGVMNGAPPVPQHFITKCSNDEEQEPGSKESNETVENLWSILYIPVLLRRMTCLFGAWFACIISFYGIGLALHSLPGNLFLNYQLLMLVELPAYIIGAYVINRTGRRITICGSIVLSGIACLAIGFVPDGKYD